MHPEIKRLFNSKFLNEIKRQLHTDYEICGNIVLDPQAKLISYDINKGDMDEIGRRRCIQQTNRSHIFHTHPANTKFPPSAEDIWKVVKNGPVNVSYIFTEFGVFVLKRLKTPPNYKHPTKSELLEITELINNEVSGPLYWATERGRKWRNTQQNKKALKEYIEIMEYNFPIEIEFFEN